MSRARSTKRSSRTSDYSAGDTSDGPDRSYDARAASSAVIACLDRMVKWIQPPQ